MLLKHTTAAMLLSSTLVFSSVNSADAAIVSTSTVSVSAGDVQLSSSRTKVSDDNLSFAQVLSSSYNRTISTREISWLRAEFDFGLGDISLVYATSVYSGRPVDEISQLRLKNMGWGEIAKLYGVKVKDLKKGNYEVVNTARQRGVDITYIEIDEDSNSNEKPAEAAKDNTPSEKGGHKKDHKHDNGKGNGHK